MIDLDMLKARVFFGLKNNSFSAENWEEVMCNALDAEHIPGDKYLADGVLNNAVLNIKTVKIDPDELKTKENRDFLSHPEKFGRLQELVQRRVGLPDLNDMQADPKLIGEKTIENFKAFEKESFDKFNCDHTLDVIVRHGVDKTLKNYIIDVYVSKHSHPDADELEWISCDHGPKSKYKGRSQIVGLKNNERVIARNSSGPGRQQNCYIIYKNLDKIENRYTTSVPIPSVVTFSKEKILEEIYKLETLQS